MKIILRAGGALCYVAVAAFLVVAAPTESGAHWLAAGIMAVFALLLLLGK